MRGSLFASIRLRLGYTRARARTRATRAAEKVKSMHAAWHGMAWPTKRRALLRTRTHTLAYYPHAWDDVEMRYEYSTECTRHGCARIHYSFPKRHQQGLAFPAPKCEARNRRRRMKRKSRIFLFRCFFYLFRNEWILMQGYARHWFDRERNHIGLKDVYVIY